MFEAISVKLEVFRGQVVSCVVVAVGSISGLGDGAFDEGCCLGGGGARGTVDCGLEQNGSS